MSAITLSHQSHHHGLHPLSWLSQAFATRRQRARLEDLDQHLLADIGVDPITADREAHRSFWDLP